jgi:DNA polymerase IV
VAMGRAEACARFAGFSPSRLPGIGPKTVERLLELGIATVGDLQRADPDALNARFGGRTGAYLVGRAHFHDDSPVATARAAKSRSSETTFDADVADPAELEAVLRRLARDVCDGLQRRGRRGRTIGIKVRLADWTTVTRARTLDAFTDDTQVVGALAVELLRAYAPPRPVRLLGVRVAGFEDAEAQPSPPSAAARGQLALPLALGGGDGG